MSRTVARWVALAAAASLSLSACGGEGGDSGEGRGKNPLVGLIGPKSGAAQVYWTEMKRGVELAGPDMEEQFGVTFDLVEQDDKGSPEVASRAVQVLLNDDNVDAIFGPSQSGPSLQVAETIQRTGRPWLVPIANADEVMDPDNPNWAFRTNDSNAMGISVSATYLWADNAKVGIFYGADAFGQSNRDGLAGYAEDNGLEVTAEEVVQPGSTDVSPAVQRMADAGVTAAYIAVSTGADTAAITRAMTQVGYEPDRILTSPVVMSGGFFDQAEPSEWKNMVMLEPRNMTDPTITDFEERYVAEYDEEATSLVAAYTSYTAAMLYAQAVDEVGEASDYEAVRQAMEDTDSLEIFGRSFEKPFSREDHDLYDEDPAGWFLFGFDPKGTMTALGSVTEQ